MPKSQTYALGLPRGQCAILMPRSLRAGVLACALAISSVSAVALASCASAPPPRVETAHRLSPSEEAEAIEAAKRHPIATTYERPQSRAAADLPVAPPKIPAEPPPAAPPPGAEAQAQEAPAPPQDQVIIVGNEPTPAAPPATAYRWPDTSSPDYVDSPYVWVDGAWVARPGRVYVDTPWVGVGIGAGRPWGHGWGYYDYGYPAPYYRRPPVVVVPSRPWGSTRGRYYDSGRRSWSWGYQSSPRREVYVAPRASESRSPAPRSVYRAPAAAPRSSGSVHRAPAVAPRSSGSVHRAPAAAPRRSSSSGGRRSVQVR